MPRCTHRSELARAGRPARATGPAARRAGRHGPAGRRGHRRTRPDASSPAAPSGRRTPPEPAWCPSFRLSRPHRVITPGGRRRLVERDQVTSASWHRAGPGQGAGPPTPKGTQMSATPLPGLLGAVAPVLENYGYLAVAGLILVENFGVPAPGETILVAASVYAGHRQAQHRRGRRHRGARGGRGQLHRLHDRVLRRPRARAAVRQIRVPHRGATGEDRAVLRAPRRPGGRRRAILRRAPPGGGHHRRDRRDAVAAFPGLHHDRRGPVGRRSGRRSATWPATTSAPSTPTSCAIRCTC